MNKDTIFGMDSLIGMNYVKYDQLVSLINTHYKGSNASELNIFIDVNSMIKPLFGSDKNVSRYVENDPLELSSAIINLCAHYREFFKRLSVNTKFYIIWGLNNPSVNELYVRTYNGAFMKSVMARVNVLDMVLSNMRALELLCPYIPGVYYFNAHDNETSAFVYHIITKLGLNSVDNYPNMENLVITKDVLALQLISDFKNIKILRPKKQQGVDISFIIDHNCLWDCFIRKVRQCKPPIEQIPVGFISNILAMTRVPERSMSNLKSVPQAYGIIMKLLKIGILNHDTIYDQTSLNTILRNVQVDTNGNKSAGRWKCINPKFQAEHVIGKNPLYDNIVCEDLYDIKSLHNIANNEYANCPLDLERL